MLFTVSLKNDKDFMKLFKKGRFSACNEVTAYFMPNKMPINRLGITVGKKIGGAVQRNRAKRIIRAAYRLNELDFPVGYDILFAARPQITDKKSCDIENFIKRRLLKEINKPFSPKNSGNSNRNQRTGNKKINK